MNLLFHKAFEPFRAPSILATCRFRRHQARLSPSPTRERLFFAAVPDVEAASRIATLAATLRAALDLKGKPLAACRFVVPLFRVEGASVEQAAERAGAVAMPPFKAMFDRVCSLRNGALVLRGADSAMGLEVLHQRLGDTFDGRPGRARPFTPHITLLRDRRLVDEQFVEPIEWTVREVVLVRGRRTLARLSVGQEGFPHFPLVRYPLQKLTSTHSISACEGEALAL